MYYQLFGLKIVVSLQSTQSKWRSRRMLLQLLQLFLRLELKVTNNKACNFPQSNTTCTYLPVLPTQPDIVYHTLNKSSCSMLCLLTLYLWSAGEVWSPREDTSSKLSGDRSLLGSPNTLRRSATFIWAVAWPIGSPSWKQAAISRTSGFYW